MPWALLFLLLLLLLGLGGSVLSTVPPVPGANDRAAARALLAQLAEHIPPQALPEQGFSCQDLRPEVLPGFAQLPPLPRALARAAMALALSGAACKTQAEAEVLGLSRELGPPKAAALLRGLAQLRSAPAPEALSFLLLTSTHPTSPGPPATGPSDEDACNPPGEQEAHRVLEWVPGVSIFYNLGTSLYYAFQGCEALASTRALEVAEDLGYAGLAALTAGAGGPVALGLQLGLQPGLKAGVRALINYFTSDGDPPSIWGCPALGHGDLGAAGRLCLSHVVAAGLSLSLSRPVCPVLPAWLWLLQPCPYSPALSLPYSLSPWPVPVPMAPAPAL
uniref:Apolipoprotein F n=1 Tax=Aquila chrysaetos chrysaetos TaxID=223781 RepID=A0A663FCP7_AQUCH